MPALSIQPTYPIFTDIDGQPLEDGFVWVGQANLDPQVNPVAVYWDAALTIPAPQPIRTLGGYPSNSGTPARLYVSGDYSIRVMNKKGSVVYGAPIATESYSAALVSADDADNGSLFTTVAGFISRLMSSAGAALVGFILLAVGAVARTVRERLQDTYHVTDFGAFGDGVVDDTSSIIAALLAASGKTLLFPAGTYLVDGSLLRIYSGTTIFGYGATLKLKAGVYGSTAYFLGTNTGITYDAGYTTTTNVAIFGLTIDGNIANVTTTNSCYGINAYKTSGFLVQDVNIKDLPGTIGGGYGIAFSFSTDAQAVNVNINRTDRQNIVVWETKNAKINGCTLKDSYFRDCILVSSMTPAVFQASECIISDTECRNTLSTGTHVIRFSGQSGGQLSNVRIYGYQSGASGLHGLYITDIYPKAIRAVNVTIDDCYRGVDVSSDAAHSIELTACQIGVEIACYDGVRVNTNLATCKINGGTVEATNQPLYMNAVDYQSVIGAEIVGGTANSAIFSESAGTTVFVGNTVRGNTNASYPVLFAGSGEPIIAANKVAGNTVNTLRATTGAIAVGNSGITVDGAAKSGVVVKRSTTANRPTLTSADVGIMFLDTTLDADGKPIWWTGTIWVDATGAAV